MIEIFSDLYGVDLPERCRDCAVQCGNFATLAALMHHKEMGNMIGESLVGDEGKEFDEMLDSHLPVEIAEEAKVHLRQSIGDGLEDIDQRVTGIKDKISADALACDGVLKMRASKGDVTYTVGVCTSQREYTRDSSTPEHTPVHINATSRDV